MDLRTSLTSELWRKVKLQKEINIITDILSPMFNPYLGTVRDIQCSQFVFKRNLKKAYYKITY